MWLWHHKRVIKAHLPAELSQNIHPSNKEWSCPGVTVQSREYRWVSISRQIVTFRSWFRGVPSIEQDKLIGFWFKHMLIEPVNFLRQWRDVSYSCCSVLFNSAYMGEAASHKEIKWLALSVRVTDAAQCSSCGVLRWDGLVWGILSCPQGLKDK